MVRTRTADWQWGQVIFEKGAKADTSKAPWHSGHWFTNGSWSRSDVMLDCAAGSLREGRETRECIARPRQVQPKPRPIRYFAREIQKITS